MGDLSDLEGHQCLTQPGALPPSMTLRHSGLQWCHPVLREPCSGWRGGVRESQKALDI